MKGEKCKDIRDSAFKHGNVKPVEQREGKIEDKPLKKVVYDRLFISIPPLTTCPHCKRDIGMGVLYRYPNICGSNVLQSVMCPNPECNCKIGNLIFQPLTESE